MPRQPRVPGTVTRLSEIRVASDFRKVALARRGTMYRKWLKNPKNHWSQDSLAQRITAAVDLSPSEIDDVLAVIGRRARMGTVARLARALRVAPELPSYGIYSRLIVTERGLPGTANYVAGQDYPAEIAVIRKLLLRG